MLEAEVRRIIKEALETISEAGSEYAKRNTKESAFDQIVEACKEAGNAE